MKISTLLVQGLALVSFAVSASATSLAATSLAATSSVGAEPEGPMLALPGFVEMLPIIAILVLLFGARKLPELARAMGSSVTQFRRGLESTDDDAQALDGSEDDKK